MKITKQENRPLQEGEVLLLIYSCEYETKSNGRFEGCFRTSICESENKAYYDQKSIRRSWNGDFLIRFESKDARKHLMDPINKGNCFTKKEIAELIKSTIEKYPTTAIICDDGTWNFIYEPTE